MSEEQSDFKVTDRRLFNPDGTPREIAREEAVPPHADTSTATSSQGRDASRSNASADRATPLAAASTQKTQSSTGAETSPQTRGSNNAANAARSPMDQDVLPDDAYVEGDAPGVNDPASFVNFIMSIASNAAAALGMMEHPATGAREVDLPLGKHWIDILGMLQQKTRGNLAAQEQQIVEGLLADLRMQYVSLGSSPRASSAPRGFTGRDITGGK